MDKVKEKLLDDFKKANAVRKEKLAAKYGFSCASDYLSYLNGDVVEEIEESKELPIIHNVTLLDATGSMSGHKYENSKAGILKELSTFNSTKEYIVKHHVYEFIDNDRGIVEYTTKFYGAQGNNTPLWWAVVEIINKFIHLPKNEKVLIKVYTDGQNNEKYQYKSICRDLIKKVQKENFTVTFVGTTYDLGDIIHSLQLDKSNTLEISNDGKGFEKAFETSRGATMSYASKVAKGEDVSTGFYLEIL